MTVKDTLYPGNEVKSGELNEDFSDLDTRLAVVEGSSATSGLKFDSNSGHRHRGTPVPGDAPQVKHGDLVGLSDDDHAIYVKTDGSKPMGSLVVAGLATARGLTVRPVADTMTAPIFQVVDFAGNVVMEAVASGGLHYLNLPGTGQYRVGGNVIRTTSVLTVGFDSISGPLPDTGEQRKVLMQPYPGSIIYVSGYVGAVGSDQSLTIDIYTEHNSVLSESLSTLTFAPTSVDAVYVDDLGSISSDVSAGDYIVVKVTQAPNGTTTDVQITLAMLMSYA